MTAPKKYKIKTVNPFAIQGTEYHARRKIVVFWMEVILEGHDLPDQRILSPKYQCAWKRSNSKYMEYFQRCWGALLMIMNGLGFNIEEFCPTEKILLQAYSLTETLE